MTRRREKKADAGAPRAGVLRVRTVIGVAAFNRCGRRFGSQWTDIPLAELAPEVIARLRAEPLLEVVDTNGDLP